MSELHSTVSDVSNVFAELEDRLQATYNVMAMDL